MGCAISQPQTLSPVPNPGVTVLHVPRQGVTVLHMPRQGVTVLCMPRLSYLCRDKAGEWRRALGLLERMKADGVRLSYLCHDCLIFATTVSSLLRLPYL